jgi:hypothetical protein
VAFFSGVTNLVSGDINRQTDLVPGDANDLPDVFIRGPLHG